MRQLRVEFGRLTHSEHKVSIAEDQTHPAGKDVQPFVAIVNARARLGSPGSHDRPGSVDCRERNDPRAQVITAAGEGSAAAIALNADLVEEDVQHAVRDLRGGSVP